MENIDEGRSGIVGRFHGTTNGVEVSPDGRLLYVNESVQRNVWGIRYRAERKYLQQASFSSFYRLWDGWNVAISKGNLFICRYDKGTVVVLSSEGKSCTSIL